jgi:hypothetical protein
MAFFNICTNPFIYAAKYDDVKKRLRGWFVCNHVGQQGDMAVNTNSLPIQNTTTTRARVHPALETPRPQLSTNRAQSQCNKAKMNITKIAVQEYRGGLAVSADNECQPGTSQSAF